VRAHIRVAHCHFSVSFSVSSEYPETLSGLSGDAVFVAGAPQQEQMDR
jgi:hypothetical protein